MEQPTVVKSFEIKIENTNNTFSYEIVDGGDFMARNEQLVEVGVCKVKFEESPPNIEYFLKEVKKSKVSVYYNSSILGIRNELIAEFKLMDYYDEKHFDKRQFHIIPKEGDKLFDMDKVTKIEIGLPEKTKCILVIFPKKLHTGTKPIISYDERYIIDGSNLMAEFMDWRIGELFLTTLRNSHCCFHKDWNWMMAITKKINTQNTIGIVIHDDIKKQFDVVFSYLKSIGLKTNIK